MPADVTVVTPSAGDRDYLYRCINGVKAQTVKPAQHLIGIDYALVGHGAFIRNALMAAATTTWIACCDDDDWFLSNHIEALLFATSSDVDVVVAEYRLETGGWIPQHQCDPAMFATTNWVHPSSILLRREAALAVGGFPAPAPPLWDDWALLQKLQQAGARFACVHEITNVKGVHADCINGPRS